MDGGVPCATSGSPEEKVVEGGHLEVSTEHDHALNGSKLKFHVKWIGSSDVGILNVETHVATMSSFGKRQTNELPITFEVLEPKNQPIVLENGSATFCGRFVFAGEAVSISFPDMS